jgi:hypothetical protein
LGPPSPPTEPEKVLELFREPVLLARDGGTFRVVPSGQHTSIRPLWMVDRDVTQHNAVDSLSGTSWATALGFYRQTTSWHYALHASRYDDAWRDLERGQWALPPEDLQHIRPLMVAELNQRSGDGRWGDRLTSILDDGVEETTYVSLQNEVILLGWLSLLPALWAIRVMFRRRSPKPIDWPPES